MRCQPARQLPVTALVIGKRFLKPERVKMNVQPCLADINAAMDYAGTVLVRRFLALYAGRLRIPLHLFRTASRRGPAKLTLGSQSVNTPPAESRWLQVTA